MILAGVAISLVVLWYLWEAHYFFLWCSSEGQDLHICLGGSIRVLPCSRYFTSVSASSFQTRETEGGKQCTRRREILFVVAYPTHLGWTVPDDVMNFSFLLIRLD